MAELQSPKKAKPKIEEVIVDVVNEAHQQTALDFVAFIRSRKMTPAWASANAWKVNYKGQILCYLRTSGTAHYHNLDDGAWHILFPVYNDAVYQVDVPDEAIRLVWNNLKHCRRCSNCSPANRLIINGKTFDNVCHQWLTIRNPDQEAMECATKLVEAIADSRQRGTAFA